MPAELIHDPWNMNLLQQKAHGIKIGEDYPKPISCPKYTNPALAKKQKAEKAAARKAEKGE